jgi:hypothetical protein
MWRLAVTVLHEAAPNNPQTPYASSSPPTGRSDERDGALR